MPKYYYDLHIHSVFSPCADELMTPNNILNMAVLKGLDFIAVTDHALAKQMPTFKKLVSSYDLVFIPGIEVTVKEGFHYLLYFKSIDDCIEASDKLENYLPPIKTNRAQVIMNEYDEEISSYPYWVGTAIELSANEVSDLLREFKPVRIMAHVNRIHASGIEYINKTVFDGIEIKLIDNKDQFIKTHDLKKHKILFNSDAHSIMNILERDELNIIDLKDKSIKSFFEYFHG